MRNKHSKRKGKRKSKRVLRDAIVGGNPDLLDNLSEELTPQRRQQKPVEPLEAKTEQQGLAISMISHCDITVLDGPAGTGKTYVATAMACEALEAGIIDKIVLTRPAVDMENFGAMPGELEDKFAPYLGPFIDILNERLGERKVKYLLKNRTIDPRPLSFMRGSTFNRAWVLLDEAQNTTPGQMKMFLTRIGYEAKMLISGDVQQSDLPKHQKSGLEDLLWRIESEKEFGVVKFEKSDAVRHNLTSKIISLYEK